MRYHISTSGEARPCSAASPESCPRETHGDFSDAGSATAWAEGENLKAAGGLDSVLAGTSSEDEIGEGFYVDDDPARIAWQTEGRFKSDEGYYEEPTKTEARSEASVEEEGPYVDDDPARIEWQTRGRFESDEGYYVDDDPARIAWQTEGRFKSDEGEYSEE